MSQDGKSVYECARIQLDRLPLNRLLRIVNLFGRKLGSWE